MGKDSIMEMDNGFILEQSCFPDKPHYKGEFAVFTDDPAAVVDYCWFRGDWFDGRTLLWNNIEKGNMPSNPVSREPTGASVYVPVKLKPNESRTIKVFMAWYVPHSDLRAGTGPDDDKAAAIAEKVKMCNPDHHAVLGNDLTYYEPWYSGKFKDVKEVAQYWRTQYADLKRKTELFTDAFYNSDLPPEVLEAVAANLTILKSPTVLTAERRKTYGPGKVVTIRAAAATAHAPMSGIMHRQFRICSRHWNEPCGKLNSWWIRMSGRTSEFQGQSAHPAHHS